MPRRLDVCYLDPPSVHSADNLSRRLGERVRITSARAEESLQREYDVLIGGYPKRAHFQFARRNSVLIIPYSGLPLETRLALLDFPAVEVHRLPYNGQAVAEMCLALLLAASKDLLAADREMRRGSWMTSPPLRLLSGRTAIVLGCGNVGGRVLTLLSALGMRVLVVRRTSTLNDSVEGCEVFGVESLDRLLPSAQVVAVCLPLTPKTVDLLNEGNLALLPDGAVLVNVGRAEIINERALYNTLAKRHSLAAGLDVWYREPFSKDGVEVLPSRFPFRRLSNVVMSPHRAWRTERSEEERENALVSILGLAAEGRTLPYRINVELGY